MKRRRVVSDSERALFEHALKDVSPLRAGKTKPSRSAAAKKSNPPLPAAIQPAKPPRMPGLDGSTANRLRKGTIAPEAKLDLHGLTEAAAHRALVTFVRGAHARGHRLVLVVTGKAREQRDDEPFDLGLGGKPRGVLHRMTPRWLQEKELAPIVADVLRAHIRHGGTGALYVYLRKGSRT